MNIFQKYNKSKVVELLFFIVIFLQISFGRFFSGLGSGNLRITTVLHIVGILIFIKYLLETLKNKKKNSIVTAQVFNFIYLFLYYASSFSNISSSSEFVQSFRHTSIFFAGVWFIVGNYISNKIMYKKYFYITSLAFLIQIFSYLYENISIIRYFDLFSDKKNRIYDATDLGMYYFLIGLVVVFLNNHRFKTEFLLFLYVFLSMPIVNASRGTFIAYFIAGLYFFTLMRNELKITFKVVFIVILVFILSLFLLPSTQKDIENGNTLLDLVSKPFKKIDRNGFVNMEDPDMNISYRLDVWNELINYSVNNSAYKFLFGENYLKTHPVQIEINKDYNSPDPLIPEYPHNFIIFLISKYGFVGLFAYIYLIFAILKFTNINKRSFFMTIIIFLFIDGLFDPVLSNPYITFLAFINLGILSNKNIEKLSI
jgi:hypothetical protein